MSWVTSAAEVAGVAFTLGTEINEHKRANHLHREQIAQGLRIHEQEAQEEGLAVKYGDRVELTGEELRKAQMVEDFRRHELDAAGLAQMAELLHPGAGL